MQSRNTLSLVTSLLLTAACAYQNAGTGLDDQAEPLADEGGSSTGGNTSKAGNPSVSVAGMTSTSSAGKPTSTSGGTGTDLPPVGSGGKTSGGSGGSGGKSSGGKAGMGGTGGMEATGGGDTGPVNMPIKGLSVTFAAFSPSDPNDYLGGELMVINDTAQPLAFADLKIRYYFSNEIAVLPTAILQWARFGPMNNEGDATCVGDVKKAETPKPGADSYVELTCKAPAATDLTAGTHLKISWKAGLPAQGKLIQAGDWSFTDPEKIIVMNGQTIVWGKPPS